MMVYHGKTFKSTMVHHAGMVLPCYTLVIPWYTINTMVNSMEIPWYTMVIPWYTIMSMVKRLKIPWYAMVYDGNSMVIPR